MTNRHSQKPNHVLTELEREPVVYFGCTWTEISGQIKRSIIVSVSVALFVSAGFSMLGLPFQGVFPIFFAIAILLTLFLTKTGLGKMAKLRAGKPLFYEKHLGSYKSSKFIQLKGVKFQRDRNHKRR